MKRVLSILLLAAFTTPVLADAVSEEIQSRGLCQQAVSAAEKRGETPSQHGIICELGYSYPPAYWYCVLNAVQKGERIVAASETCR